MAMSSAQLRRLAAAEDQGSTAAGAIGVNAMLLDFHRQNEKRQRSVENTHTSVSANGTKVVHSENAARE